MPVPTTRYTSVRVTVGYRATSTSSTAIRVERAAPTHPAESPPIVAPMTPTTAPMPRQTQAAQCPACASARLSESRARCPGNPRVIVVLRSGPSAIWIRGFLRIIAFRSQRASTPGPLGAATRHAQQDTRRLVTA